MAKFPDFLAVCVLVLTVQADTLLRLAECDLYRPRWIDVVVNETVLLRSAYKGRG